jgi:hypothetical protein
MHDHEEFLWTGLRARLERMGKVRPHTIRTEAVGQKPKRRLREAPSNSAKAAGRHAATQPVRMR